MTCLNFRIHKQVQYGQAIYLSLAEDNWSLQKARRMNFVKNFLWSIEFTSDSQCFEYKYIISDYDQFDINNAILEEGLNRYCRATIGQNRTINDRWNMRNVQIILSGLNANEDKVILIGTYSNIQVSNLMSPIVYKNQDLHIAKLLVHINDIKSLKFQYYVQKKKKSFENDKSLELSNQTNNNIQNNTNIDTLDNSNNNIDNNLFNKYLSTEFSLDYSKQKNYEMIKIKFTKIK